MDEQIKQKKPDRRQLHKDWRTIGGKRHYFKSLWEANYAHYLQWLKEKGDIVDWDYEPETFWFEKRNKKGDVVMAIRRGTNNYKPDFRVKHKKLVWLIPGGPKSDKEYVEIKGYVTKKDLVKMDRMKRYHPDILIRMVGAEWFKKNNTLFKNIVPGWEMHIK